MLSLEALFNIRRHLSSADASTDLSDLRVVLAEIYKLDEYQSWLEINQYASSSSPEARFRMPIHFGNALSNKQKWLPERLGIVNGDTLFVKVDNHNRRLHITDGNWVSPTFRVYPFTEESEQIVNYVTRNSIADDVDLLVDPACGCGHHGLGLSKIPRKINLDINPRALEFARINALIAGMPEVLCVENDVRNNMPVPLDDVQTEHILFAANMPFAIFPKLDTRDISLAQEGGNRGVELTTAVVQMIANYMKQKVERRTIAVVLCYSLGVPEGGRWDILEIASKILAPNSFKFELLSGEKMWRVNGKKEHSNPMSLEQLSTKATCRHTYSPDQVGDAAIGYETLTKAYQKEKWTHLGYGVLHIDSAGNF